MSAQIASILSVDSFLISKLPCPDSQALGTYLPHGLTADAAKRVLEQRGPNQFEIRMPTFQELYLEGLLAPFSVFQVRPRPARIVHIAAQACA